MKPPLAVLRRWAAGQPDPSADGTLLARFATGDDAAFDELVRRHGPMVLGVCRRLLPDAADADDAFQAVFLVLVRRAGRVAGRPALGPWLYRVAVWTAHNQRRRNARRAAVREPLPDAVPDPAPDVAALRIDLDEAILALPERYRTPVVLCHLQGWSRRDAARHLGCPEGTLSALLSRALAKLRHRLQGCDPALSLAVTGVAAVAPGLASATTGAASALRTGSLTAAAASPAVAQLTERVLRMFWLKQAAAAGVIVAAALVTGVGLGMGGGPGQHARADGPPAIAAAAPAAPVAARPASRQSDELNRVERELRRLESQLAELRAAADVRVVPDAKDQARVWHEAENARLRFDELRRRADVARRPFMTPEETAAHQAAEDARRKWEEARRKAHEIGQEADKRRKAEAERGAAAPVRGAFLLLEVAPGFRMGTDEFTVTEHDAEGKYAGSVRCVDSAALAKFLARAHADPSGPRELAVSLPTRLTPEARRAVLSVAQAGGFPRITEVPYVARPAASGMDPFDGGNFRK